MVKNPDVKKLGEFVRVTKVSLDWLLERKGGDPDLAPPQTTRRRRSRSADPAASDNAAGGLDLPIPEIAPQLSAHASQIDMTPRALWVLPHQVLEIGFNSVPEASVIKRVVTRGGMEFGLARGDYMIIDTSRQRVDEAGMYIVADPAGLSAFRVLINEKDGKLSVAAVADDLQRSNPQLSVDNLPTLGRVMGIFKPT